MSGLTTDDRKHIQQTEDDLSVIAMYTENQAIRSSIHRLLASLEEQEAVK